MAEPELEFYATPAPMSALPDHPALADRPTGLAELRRLVQGLLVHRDLAGDYGIGPAEVRADEPNIRSTEALLTRAVELSSEPVTVARQPVQRVLCICRHFALLYTALLRSEGVPARVRCGFANYFDPTKWFDHWITERWDGERWARDDPQVDDLQSAKFAPDFDVNDQPPGHFLSGAEAWVATRDGDLDPALFGIFDMWGQSFIGGNVLSDIACLNKVELLPWDGWGTYLEFGPHDELPEHLVRQLDDLASLVNSGDFPALRTRYLEDDGLRVPNRIVTFSSGSPVEVDILI